MHRKDGSDQHLRDDIFRRFLINVVGRLCHLYCRYPLDWFAQPGDAAADDDDGNCKVRREGRRCCSHNLHNYHRVTWRWTT